MQEKEDRILTFMQVTRFIVLAATILLFLFYGVAKSSDEYMQREARNYIETVQNYTLISKEAKPFTVSFLFRLQNEAGETTTESVNIFTYLSFEPGDTVACVSFPHGIVPLRGGGNEYNAAWASSANATQNDKHSGFSINWSFSVNRA